MLHCIASKAGLILGLFSWSYSTADDLLTSWVFSALIVAEKFQHFHFVCNYDKTGRSVSNFWNQNFSASYSATSIFSHLHILIRPPDKFNFWAAKVWFLFLQILQVRTTIDSTAIHRNIGWIHKFCICQFNHYIYKY